MSNKFQGPYPEFADDVVDEVDDPVKIVLSVAVLLPGHRHALALQHGECEIILCLPDYHYLRQKALP